MAGRQSGVRQDSSPKTCSLDPIKLRDFLLDWVRLSEHEAAPWAAGTKQRPYYFGWENDGNEGNSTQPLLRDYQTGRLEAASAEQRPDSRECDECALCNRGQCCHATSL
jgi:hypothetical protein